MGSRLRVRSRRRLLVVDSSGQVQGVISINDIVLSSQGKRQPAASEVVSTLAANLRPPLGQGGARLIANNRPPRFGFVDLAMAAMLQLFSSGLP